MTGRRPKLEFCRPRAAMPWRCWPLIPRTSFYELGTHIYAAFICKWYTRNFEKNNQVIRLSSLIISCHRLLSLVCSQYTYMCDAGEKERSASVHQYRSLWYAVRKFITVCVIFFLFFFSPIWFSSYARFWETFCRIQRRWTTQITCTRRKKSSQLAMR